MLNRSSNDVLSPSATIVVFVTLLFTTKIGWGQKKEMKLLGDPVLSMKLPPFAHGRAVGDFHFSADISMVFAAYKNSPF